MLHYCISYLYSSSYFIYLSKTTSNNFSKNILILFFYDFKLVNVYYTFRKE